MKDYEERCPICAMQRFEHDPVCPILLRDRKSGNIFGTAVAVLYVLGMLGIVVLFYLSLPY